MKIGYLGAGTWGFALETLLASKGYEVVIWTIDKGMAERMNGGGDHPKLPGHHALANMHYTEDLAEALDGIDMLVEGVTSAGLRPVLEEVKKVGVPDCPIVLTSKGIEQNTGLLLSDLAVEVLGEEHRKQIGCLSGPSHAEEVVRGLPTTVVSSAYDPQVMMQIQETFTSDRFRVYPNADIDGVEFCGALKNVVAIACGISDGLGFGDNTKAALMTRGLHEIRKLGVEMGCEVETINGLAGMGDLCVTCMSNFSRNYRFGRLLAEGHSAEEAKKRIGMVVEGEYSVVSAVQLGKKHGISLPIAQTVYGILYEGLAPQKAVNQLFTRPIKEEHL
jgi:glycerol-3-phosphate dehydrogenase (NAD(P)+)